MANEGRDMTRIRMLLPLFFAVGAVTQAKAVDCQYRATTPTLSDQSIIMLQCDSSGRLSSAIIGGAFGTTADAAYAGSGAATLISIEKGIYNAVSASIPAGTAIIGKVGIDQTTPGTTNGVQDAATGATASAVPTKAMYQGVVSSGNLVGLIQADASAVISVAAATTTQLVALSASKKIYVTSFDIIAGGTGNIKFVYGTGAACGTGTTDLTGNYNLTAQNGLWKGSGLGPVLVVPASQALCVTTSAAVQMSGSISYTQF